MLLLLHLHLARPKADRDIKQAVDNSEALTAKYSRISVEK